MIYLDHNATTPVLAEVVRAMLPFLERDFGNPSSAHRLGSNARCAVEEAREQVARLIGGEAAGVIFTSGGTESNNLAIEGVARASGRPGHVVTTQIEHSSVLAPLARLEREGWEVTRLPVDEEGRVAPEAIAAAISPATRLVTIGWANNEIGTIQPIDRIGAICRARGVPLHVDAIQAAGKVKIDCAAADLLSLSAHKIGGPKGIGALWVRPGLRLEPLLLGGSQERGRRAGTENVAGAVGFGVACALASRRLQAVARLAELRERLWEALRDLPGVRRNSPLRGCLCNTLNVSFCGFSADALVAALDLRGIAVSSGSACAAGASEPSHVLRALGREEALARDAIRFSLGPETTAAEIDEVGAAVRSIVCARGERLAGGTHA